MARHWPKLVILPRPCPWIDPCQPNVCQSPKQTEVQNWSEIGWNMLWNMLEPGTSKVGHEASMGSKKITTKFKNTFNLRPVNPHYFPSQYMVVSTGTGTSSRCRSFWLAFCITILWPNCRLIPLALATFVAERCKSCIFAICDIEMFAWMAYQCVSLASVNQRLLHVHHVFMKGF